MFYKEWKKIRDAKSDDSSYQKSFLCHDVMAILPFINEGDGELENFFDVMSEIKIRDLLLTANGLPLRNDFKSNEIPCFSTFEMGAVRIPELLEFSPEGLTFRQIGAALTHNYDPAPSQKYGENHSRLAEILHLVTVDESVRPQIVKETELGHFLIKYPYSEKKHILKSLLLQNDFLKFVAAKAITDDVVYSELVYMLSENTARRRRQGVKKLVAYLYDGTGFESKFKNINWDV